MTGFTNRFPSHFTLKQRSFWSACKHHRPCRAVTTNPSLRLNLKPGTACWANRHMTHIFMDSGTDNKGGYEKKRSFWLLYMCKECDVLGWHLGQTPKRERAQGTEVSQPVSRCMCVCMCVISNHVTFQCSRVSNYFKQKLRVEEKKKKGLKDFLCREALITI